MGARKNNGSVVRRETAKGGVTYQVQFRFQGGSITKSFDNEPEARVYLASISNDHEAMAEAAERKQRADMLARAAMSPESRLRALLDTPIRKILEGFKECNLARERHKKAIPAMLKEVKQATVREMRKSWVKGFIDGMRGPNTLAGRPYAYSTIVRQIAVLRHAVDWAADEQEVDAPKIPFSTKTMFPKNWEGKRNRRLARDEEIALVAKLRSIRGASRHHWRLLLRMALETGARLQELSGMLWSEIDRGHWSIPGVREKMGLTRSVPLSPAALRALHVLRLLRDPENPRVFHALGEPDSVSALFRRYCKQAGLVKFSFHCLRHEAISRMVAKNPDVYAIMLTVGHESAEMLSRYTHLRNDELAKALFATQLSQRRA